MTQDRILAPDLSPRALYKPNFSKPERGRLDSPLASHPVKIVATILAGGGTTNSLSSKRLSEVTVTTAASPAASCSKLTAATKQTSARYKYSATPTGVVSSNAQLSPRSSSRFVSPGLPKTPASTVSPISNATISMGASKLRHSSGELRAAPTYKAEASRTVTTYTSTGEVPVYSSTYAISPVTTSAAPVTSKTRVVSYVRLSEQSPPPGEPRAVRFSSTRGMSPTPRTVERVSSRVAGADGRRVERATKTERATTRAVTPAVEKCYASRGYVDCITMDRVGAQCYNAEAGAQNSRIERQRVERFSDERLKAERLSANRSPPERPLAERKSFQQTNGDVMTNDHYYQRMNYTPPEYLGRAYDLRLEDSRLVGDKGDRGYCERNGAGDGHCVRYLHDQPFGAPTTSIPPPPPGRGRVSEINNTTRETQTYNKYTGSRVVVERDTRRELREQNTGANLRELYVRTATTTTSPDRRKPSYTTTTSSTVVRRASQKPTMVKEQPKISRMVTGTQVPIRRALSTVSLAAPKNDEDYYPGPADLISLRRCVFGETTSQTTSLPCGLPRVIGRGRGNDIPDNVELRSVSGYTVDDRYDMPHHYALTRKKLKPMHCMAC